MRGKPDPLPSGPEPPRIIPAHAGQTLGCFLVIIYSTDHPRACGANHGGRQAYVIDYGSSPRMRGKRRGGRLHAVGGRIIPAHAGQTRWGGRVHRQKTDHPRACGANAEAIAQAAAEDGSSPRMRGKLVGMVVFPRPKRIIPAHAGQTLRKACFRGGLTDHPRACGANEIRHLNDTIRNGSSPRMRGKRISPQFCIPYVRIIPAHAGQTQRGPRHCAYRTDHPRACGANQFFCFGESVGNGSSPRMRGKPDRASSNRRQLRIIPAHAGQTTGDTGLSVLFADHPRACGANAVSDKFHGRTNGSSPRMRGKHVRVGQRSAFHRIIPAHAGQTFHHSAPHQDAPDHPRACGANANSSARRSAIAGSSPRMRGKPPYGHAPLEHTRIIPAHAGQTLAAWSGRSLLPDHPRACGAN